MELLAASMKSLPHSLILPLQYEPELFPGLIYRMKSPKIVLLIFVSGKVVLTGACPAQDLPAGRSPCACQLCSLNLWQTAPALSRLFAECLFCKAGAFVVRIAVAACTGMLPPELSCHRLRRVTPGAF